MFDLPKDCIVNKFIPKKTFYEKLNVATLVKDEFVDIVDKITWLYKISEDTFKSNKTDNVEEIEIFQIDLKAKKIPKNVIKIISKAIPYKILFVLKWNSDICYSISAENNYYTEWNDNTVIEFKGFDLETIYQNIVRIIIKEQDNEKHFEKVIQDNTRKNVLEKQIEALKNKVRSEKQFNKKVELNQELRKLENEMEELLNG
ncbi:MAG TPA: DUF4391 domain-containing protein [Bacilli bacterium]|nr:DUF4391 domain-containing protein [Bacilli bacterium]